MLRGESNCCPSPKDSAFLKKSQFPEVENPIRQVSLPPVDQSLGQSSEPCTAFADGHRLRGDRQASENWNHIVRMQTADSSFGYPHGIWGDHPEITSGNTFGHPVDFSYVY